MTTATDNRQSLAEYAEGLGWQRREHPRVDVYIRGIFQVHAIWRDTEILNGGVHYEDSIMLAHTRELAKLQAWLAR